MSAPSVTAVVTVHNQARYLAEALASVLAQTRAPLDVVVLDDGSTDEPGGVCAQFGAAVTYVRQPRRGVGAARNAGLRHARGDFLAYLDGDDVWEPGHVEAQVTALDRVPGAGLVITDGVEFDEGGIRCDGLLGRPVREALNATSDAVVPMALHDALLAENLIFTASQAAVPRAVFARVGPWREDLRGSDDYELWLRIARHYPVAVVRASLTRWRYTATSASGHEELRPFTWGRWNFDALRAHWPLVPGPKRPAFRRHLDEVATGLARSAYHRAVREDRRWGTRYLLALAGASRRPARVLPYLLALWTPARVRSGLGRLARRAPR